jgi:flagellar biosynthesis/type III secretory pathway M-ring protein FliF/YscJ
MQALQRTFQNIAGQLRGLTPTAKMLIGSLMIILVMALLLVSVYAGRQTMAPLGLSASMSQDAKARAASYLDARSIPYKDVGGDLHVPVEQKLTILAQLADQQLISPDQINFEKLVTDASPFLTQYQNRQRYLVAKMNVLAQMISQMRGIEKAVVVIDQPEGSPALGKARIAPSASVNVLPRAELTQMQVDAIAQLVAGSHAGLTTANVAIIDARTGKAMSARSDDVLSSGKYLEVKLAIEQQARKTIEDALNFIPGLVVAVNAQVDTSEVLTQRSTIDEPKVGPTLDSSRSITSTAPSPAAPAGVQSNVGTSILLPGRNASQMTDERSESRTVPVFGRDERQIKDGKGYPLQINASIAVPRSYFVRLYQEREGKADAQPDAATFDALVQLETDRIKNHVTPLIDTGAMEGAVAGIVRVSMSPDFATVSSGGPAGDSAAPSTAGLGGSLVSDGIVKYVSLGGLALLSLTMMFMMVRKASVRDPLPTAQELVGIPPALAAADGDLVGEADEASPALEGLELNDDAIRRSQMLDQITDMVTKAPDDAANLLRRWMKSEA